MELPGREIREEGFRLWARKKRHTRKMPGVSTTDMEKARKYDIQNKRKVIKESLKTKHR